MYARLLYNSPRTPMGWCPGSTLRMYARLLYNLFQSHIGPISTLFLYDLFMDLQSILEFQSHIGPISTCFVLPARLVEDGSAFQSHIGPISTRSGSARTYRPRGRFNPILVRFQPDLQIPLRSRSPCAHICFNPILVRFQPVRAHPWIPTRGPSTSPLERSIYKGS